MATTRQSATAKRYPEIVAKVSAGGAPLSLVRSWAASEIDHDGVREVVDAIAAALDQVRQNPAIVVKGESKLKRDVADLKAQLAAVRAELAIEPGRADFEDLLELIGMSSRDFEVSRNLSPAEFRARYLR